MVPGTSMLCRARCSASSSDDEVHHAPRTIETPTSNRTQLADAAQNHLLATMLPPNPHALRSNAARHLIATSQRHRRRLPALAGLLICRTCKRLIRPGVDARFRIRSGQRIMTCLECGSIRRWGVEGVPDDRRKRAKAALASDPADLDSHRSQRHHGGACGGTLDTGRRSGPREGEAQPWACGSRGAQHKRFRDLATSSGTDLLVARECRDLWAGVTSTEQS